MGWTVEDYKRLGMQPPAELMAQNQARRPVPTPPPPKPAQSSSLADVYRNALARRLRESGVE